MEEGCEIIDSTITGMGRGAGNLRTELLLTYLESQKKIKIDFNKLGNVVSKFEDLKSQYNWGTSLPYMFSGAYSLPQKEVMEWLGMNRYSLSSILNALNNKKLIQEDNFKLPIFKKTKQYDKILIIGGGDSVQYNKLALEKLFELNDKIALILVGVKNIKTFSKIKNDKFITLIGIESKESFKDINSNEGYAKFIYGPFPRKMGISVPENFLNKSAELNEISFTNEPKDSLFAIACQLAIDLAVKEILMIGFDGYDTNINKNQSLLEKENQCIINDLRKNKDLNIFSLNPSNYDNLKLTSIYSLLK
jgi:4-hydroxy 2-oxovalerate aldolase